MLKAKRGSLIVFGFNRAEMERLTSGAPLIVHLDDIGIPHAVAGFFVGEDDAKMKEQFEKSVLNTTQGKIDLSAVHKSLIKP